MTTNYPMILKTAEPFFFPGDEVGCLLIHGFTGTPKEMLPLGEHLSKCGHTVLGIRLPGHATKPEDLLHVHWNDWLASIEDGLNLLKNNTRKIFVMGLSMGGMLSLVTAAKYQVDGIVVMATPYFLPKDWRLKFISLIKYIQPGVDKGPSDWHNKDAESSHVSYPYYPTGAIPQLIELQKTMHAVIPEVKVPTLLIYSREDMTANPNSMKMIYEQLSSKDKEMVWVENSGHVITREPEREKVFKSVEHFISRLIRI